MRSGFLWRTLAKRHPRGTVLPKHQHQTGQLVYAQTGVMLVETQGNRWTIPPQRALWIPPDQSHAIRMLSDTELRTVYFQPSLLTHCHGFERRSSVHAIVVSPLIKELILALFTIRYDLDVRDTMAQLLLHVLQAVDLLPTDLPMPSDEGLRRVAFQFLANPGNHLSLADVAETAAMSERTFTRRFAEDVGISFRAWRQRARIIASLDVLATHRPIKFVAHAMGFSSTAAYAAAFRNLLGCTPGEFRGKSANPDNGDFSNRPPP